MTNLTCWSRSAAGGGMRLLQDRGRRHPRACAEWLFIFVIMLLNAGAEERTKGSHVAIILGVPGVLAGGLLIAWTLLQRSETGSVALGALPGSPKTIGHLLFHDFLLPFEVTSVLVLIAIMGAVVLAQRAETPNLPPGKEV